MSAWVDEPEPVGDGNAVYFKVINDISARASVGIDRYGTMLKTNNGRDALMDAYAEAIDLVMYIAQAIMERDNK